MFRKILIANRGEIALRIIWACRELGIRTVAVHSEADAHSLHVRFADEDICIGPAPSAQSYLSITQLISAAEITDADAIHPGFGFLSENPQFAEVCAECGITFIGPSPRVIQMMGDKAEARNQARQAGVPILPGCEEPLRSEEAALDRIKEIGYPVILKAVSGGGGRGMRIIRNERELRETFQVAQTEAANAFQNPDLYLEKYLTNPRHIEFQILADQYDNLLHLGERECSIQRRHQKLLEEAPSTALTPEKREEMGAAALRLARQIGYTNAGTIEFLLDEDGSYSFMEMNTRIQVEHPVTEMVTGVDLIHEQIRIAAGERLSVPTDRPLHLRGHAIECRINAEDPETFVPCPGRITVFHAPGGPGVRLDTAAHAEGVISPYYDSMIAKLIVWGRDRTEALNRMRRSLDCTVIEGVKTTIPLHRRILAEEDFAQGRLSTKFMDRFLT